MCVYVCSELYAMMSCTLYGVVALSTLILMKRLHAGHGMRMGKERDPTRTLEGHYRGRRMVGRPRNRWEDMLQGDAVNLLEIRNWKAAARNREEWRRIVEEATARKRAEAP